MKISLISITNIFRKYKYNVTNFNKFQHRAYYYYSGNFFLSMSKSLIHYNNNCFCHKFQGIFDVVTYSFIILLYFTLIFILPSRLCFFYSYSCSSASIQTSYVLKSCVELKYSDFLFVPLACYFGPTSQKVISQGFNICTMFLIHASIIHIA